MSDRALPREAAPRRSAAAANGHNGSRPETELALRLLHTAVPGRVRVAIPGLKRAPEEARRLETLTATWAGVRRASANATTGNLLLEFDPRQLAVEQLVARLREVVGSTPGRRQPRVKLPSSEPPASTRPAASTAAPTAARPASIVAALEAAPVPPRLQPRARALEAALGGAALISAGALLVAVRAYGHNLAIDQAPLAVAQELHSPGLTALMIGASHLAEPAVLWPATLGAMLLGVGRQRPGEFPWLAPVAMGGGVSVISLLKVLLHRARPAVFTHLAPARGYSLPSGHAFLAATLYGLLAQHGIRWLRARRPDDRRAAAALLAFSTAAILLVGLSRVYLGVHYPTDVIAGYALALLWLLFLSAVHERPMTAPTPCPS